MTGYDVNAVGYTVTASGAVLDISRYAGDHASFQAHLTVAPYSQGSATITQSADNKSVDVALAGQAAQNEIWSITLKGHTYSYTVGYGDDLAAVAVVICSSRSGPTPASAPP